MTLGDLIISGLIITESVLIIAWLSSIVKLLKQIVGLLKPKQTEKEN